MHYQTGAHQEVQHRAVNRPTRIPIIAMTTIKTDIMKEIQITRTTKCRCLKIKTRTLDVEQLSVIPTNQMPEQAGKPHKVVTHFSNFSSNQLFRGGRISSKERGSSITKLTIQWTSRIKQILLRIQTRLLLILVMVVAL